MIYLHHKTPIWKYLIPFQWSIKPSASNYGKQAYHCSEEKKIKNRKYYLQNNFPFKLTVRFLFPFSAKLIISWDRRDKNFKSAGQDTFSFDTFVLAAIQGDTSKPRFPPHHFPDKNLTWMSQNSPFCSTFFSLGK